MFTLFMIFAMDNHHIDMKYRLFTPMFQSVIYLLRDVSCMEKSLLFRQMSPPSHCLPFNNHDKCDIHNRKYYHV